MDLTVIVALITALAAIIAPVFTAFINNLHEQKMKRIEMYEAKRIEVINEYVSRAEKYIENIGDLCMLDKFQQYKNQAYLYMPKSLWQNIDELHHAIDTNDQESAKTWINVISKSLSDYIFEVQKRK